MIVELLNTYLPTTMSYMQYYPEYCISMGVITASIGHIVHSDGEILTDFVMGTAAAPFIPIVLWQEFDMTKRILG